MRWPIPRSGASECRALFLDLRGLLRDARGKASLYHHTDTHWNQLGAAHAVKRLIEAVRESFPEVPRFRMDEFEVFVEEAAFAGNLAAQLRVYGEVCEEPFLRLRRRTPPRARLDSKTQPIDLRVHSRVDRIIEYSTG